MAKSTSPKTAAAPEAYAEAITVNRGKAGVVPAHGPNTFGGAFETAFRTSQREKDSAGRHSFGNLSIGYEFLFLYA